MVPHDSEPPHARGRLLFLKTDVMFYSKTSLVSVGSVQVCMFMCACTHARVWRRASSVRALSASGLCVEIFVYTVWKVLLDISFKAKDKLI